MATPDERVPKATTTARPDRAVFAADVLGRLADVADPGDRLGTKAEVRQRCGVSVGTFNEALKLAQARGTVVLRPGPGGGLFAGKPSSIVRLGNSVLGLDDHHTSVAEAVRMRDALDPLLVEDALEHCRAFDTKAMMAELKQMRASIRADDALAFIRANWRLHAVIAAVSPHAVLKTVYINLLDVIESHTLEVRPTAGNSLPRYIADRYDLHERLVGAITAGDRFLALSLIREHNTTTPDKDPV